MRSSDPTANEINQHSSKLNIWFPSASSTTQTDKKAPLISANEDNAD